MGHGCTGDRGFSQGLSLGSASLWSGAQPYFLPPFFMPMGKKHIFTLSVLCNRLRCYVKHAVAFRKTNLREPLCLCNTSLIVSVINRSYGVAGSPTPESLRVHSTRSFTSAMAVSCCLTLTLVQLCLRDVIAGSRLDCSRFELVLSPAGGTSHTSRLRVRF